MRKINRKSFEELLLENKAILLKDEEAIRHIEERIEQRHEMKRSTSITHH